MLSEKVEGELQTCLIEAEAALEQDIKQSLSSKKRFFSAVFIGQTAQLLQ